MIRLLLLTLTLVGCASTPSSLVPPPTASEVTRVEGRLSVTQPDRRDTGSFEYRRNLTEQQWRFSGPTGTHIGQLTLSEDQARWSPAKGEVQLAPTSEALTKETLGVSIPLEKANQWLTGTAPTAGQLGTWQLEYLRYDEFDRPRIIELTQGSTRVRIVVKTWQYSPNS